MDHPQFIRILCAALCLLTIFEFSLGVDTLSENQILVDGEVLISPGQIFELGFFSRGTSRSRFLGIWYKATPDIVVWVANRNNPIMDSQGVLTLAKNGTLVLSTAQSAIIWSSNSSWAASSPVLQLLHTGNLVLVDKRTADSSSQKSYMWQSFDYPSDTRLPGMKTLQDPETGESKYLTSWKSADDPSTGEFSYKIENSGLSQIIITKGTKKINRNVFWNGHFIGFPILPDPAWKIEVESNRGRLISVFRPPNESVSSRLTMNYSGWLQRYTMNEQKDGWILMAASPSNTCDNYGFCGHNGICTAYGDPYFNNESSCLMWFGDLIDIREHTGDADVAPSIYIRVPLFDLATVAAATNNFSGENVIGEGGFGLKFFTPCRSE